MRVTAVAPEVADRKMNLCQRSRAMLSESVMGMPAALAASTRLAMSVCSEDRSFNAIGPMQEERRNFCLPVIRALFSRDCG